MKKLIYLAVLSVAFIACERDEEKEPGIASLTGDSRNVCPATSVVLTASASDAKSYKWMKNGEVLVGETSNVLTVTSSGQYAVLGVNGKGEGALARKDVTIGICRDPIEFSLDETWYSCYVYDRIGEKEGWAIEPEQIRFSTDIMTAYRRTFEGSENHTYREWQMEAFDAYPYLPLIINHGPIKFNDRTEWTDTFFIESGRIVSEDFRFIDLQDVPLKALQTMMAYMPNQDEWGTLTFDPKNPADMAVGGAIETKRTPFMVVRSTDGWEWGIEDIELTDGRILKAVPAIWLFFTTDVPDVTEEGWRWRFGYNDFLATRLLLPGDAPRVTPTLAMRNYPQTPRLSYKDMNTMPEIKFHISADQIKNIGRHSSVSE